MRITGTLEFTDIGTGVWHIVSENSRNRLHTSSTQAARLSADTEVTVQVTALDGEVLDFAMLGDDPVQLEAIIE